MFITEQAMVESIKNNVSPICSWDTGKYSTQILEEVNLGFGKADLVISKIRSQQTKTTQRLHFFDIVVYSIVSKRKEVTCEALLEVTRCDKRKLNNSLKKLISEQYVCQKGGVISLKCTYKPVTSSSIAIEAKLKNWKRALDQAFRYQWFADKVYVILDAAHINPALKNIHEFKRLNVGLAAIDIHEKLQFHFKPARKAPLDAKMRIMLNELLKDHFCERRNVFQLLK